MGKCDSGCEYTINSTTFESNEAKLEGGGIYYTQQRPEMNDIDFQNNTANYGEDIGSFGLKYLLNGARELSLDNVASS